jgi:hypothetical protein
MLGRKMSHSLNIGEVNLVATCQPFLQTSCDGKSQTNTRVSKAFELLSLVRAVFYSFSGQERAP